MKGRGTITNIIQDWKTKQIIAQITFSEVRAANLEKYKDKDIDIEIEKHTEHRSGAANRMLWECLGIAAAANHTDKWSLYLNALRLYGKFTLINVLPEAVEDFKKSYRECEDIGFITVNGKEMRQVLCYYGSSTYNSREFSRLLSGVIDDMKQAGLETPTSQEMQRALEELENG